ncbi:MAG: sigma-70 family RNA polymerase sigma factor [Pseudomonadota bacterium]
MNTRRYDPGLENFIDDRERLIAIALRIVGSHAVAEELVQESWLRWNGRGYAADKATPIFRKIVKNLALDWRRRSNTETEIIGSIMDVFDDYRDAERIVIARDEIKRIVKALEELEPRVATAFRLNRIDGLSLTEIAKRMETVPSRIHAYVVKALSHVTYRLME